MDFIGRRLFSACLACFFALWSVLFPVTVSAATYSAASKLTGNSWYVPGVGTPAAGSAILATAASALGRASPWVTAITVGVPIAKVILETKAAGNVNLSPMNALMPFLPGWLVGWADSNTPPQTIPVTNPTSTPAVGSPTLAQMRYNASQGWTSTGVSACALFAPVAGCNAPRYAGYDGGLNKCLCLPDGPFGGTLSREKLCNSVWQPATKEADSCSGAPLTYSCPNGGTLSGTNCLGGTCPAGYSQVGADCQLTNDAAVKWPNDGEPTFRATAGGGWEQHPRDADPSPYFVSGDAAGPAPDYSTDPHGNPLQESVTPTPGGGLTWSQNVQTTNNNQTFVTNNTVKMDNVGNVISVSSRTVPGVIGDPANATKAEQIPFPDDYNREATQTKILTGVDAADFPDWNQDVETKKLAAEAELKTKLDEIPGQFGADKGNWFSWVWTPPVGQCEPWVHDIRGRTVTWNVCPWVEKLRDVLGFLFAIGGAWVVYNEMFRRSES